jgi:hypothetical protein
VIRVVVARSGRSATDSHCRAVIEMYLAVSP